jgi:2-polyprenyl-3-methyl-5-hydroxy-6-metoxy-1,4-benzoquinol methylase
MRPALGPVVFDHLIEFTGKPEQEVLDLIGRGALYAKDCWEKANPITPEDKLKFYQETDSYLYDLASWHCTYGKFMNDNEIADNIRNQIGDKRVLDYGCGIGDNAIALARRSVKVLAVDLPSKTLDFCTFRVDKLNLKDMIEVTTCKRNHINKYINKYGKFGAVLCMDVLEHLATWDEVIETATYLRSVCLGAFILSAPTGDQGGLHPQHLAPNPEKELELKKIVENKP